LHYQLSGDLDLDSDAEVFLVDLFDVETQDLDALHERGRLVVAYLSAGSLEPWRADADQFPAQVIGRPLDGYPRERWLDVRDGQVRTLMRARLQLARDKGFDGVFASALGAYRVDSGFALSQQDQVDYDRFLAATSRELGLSSVLSGDFELASELDDAFDWVLASQCIARQRCDALLPFVALGVPVLDLESAGERPQLCERATELGVSVMVQEPDSDVWSDAC
jgi:hypothetical protein